MKSECRIAQNFEDCIFSILTILKLLSDMLELPTFVQCERSHPTEMAKNQRRDVQRFRDEKIIPIKNVPKLTELFINPPCATTVRNWCVNGIVIRGEVVTLRHRREGRTFSTSVEAVEEFLEKINP